MANEKAKTETPKTELMPPKTEGAPKVEASAAPTPPATPSALAAQARRREPDELDAAREELEQLVRAQELDLVKAEIAKRKSMLKQHAAKDRAERLALEKREKTVKEDDGRIAVYMLGERAYKPSRPGEPPEIREKGTIIKVKAETIPGPSMIAVEPLKTDKAEFKAV